LVAFETQPLCSHALYLFVELAHFLVILRNAITAREEAIA
jgi:hypothetical protein